MGLREQSIMQQAGGAIPASALVASVVLGSVPQGFFTLGSGGAITITLPTPVAGPASEGGDDGKAVEFTTATAHAHVVGAAAGKINGADITATSSAAVGNFLRLVALGGIWWVTSNLNFTLA